MQHLETTRNLKPYLNRQIHMTCTKKGPFTPWTLVQNTAVLDSYSHEKALTIVSAQSLEFSVFKD